VKRCLEIPDVTWSRTDITAYIGLGSNVGDRAGYLQAALQELDRVSDLRVVGVSPVYETAPAGVLEQPDFLNAVVEVRSHLEPRTLLREMQRIEDRLGRTRTERWGPRTIDLDLLFHGDAVLDEEDLVLPHPRLHERAFVLVPLCDLAPDLVHPLLGKAVRELCREVGSGQTHGSAPTRMAPFATYDLLGGGDQYKERSNVRTLRL